MILNATSVIITIEYANEFQKYINIDINDIPTIVDIDTMLPIKNEFAK